MLFVKDLDSAHVFLLNKACIKRARLNINPSRQFISIGNTKSLQRMFIGLIGSRGECRPDLEFPLFVRWHREGKLKLDELVTRHYPLEQINEAVDDLEHGRILGRAIVTYA